MALNVAVGIAVAIGAFLFFMGFDQTNRGRAVTARDQLGPPVSIRDRIDSMFQANEQWAASATAAKPGKLSLAEQISRADLKLRTSEWVLIRVGTAVVLALVGLLRFGLAAFGVQALVLGVIGFFLPQWYLGFRQRRRLKAFNSQLGDTLVMMANALKSVALPGESLTVRLVKPGDQIGQGIGYLDDGTMVVVEQGRSYIGQEVTLVVTSVLQTPAGRMIFGRVESRPAA